MRRFIPYVATLAAKQKLRWADQDQINKITKDLKQVARDGVLLQYGDGSIDLVAFGNIASNPQWAIAAGSTAAVPIFVYPVPLRRSSCSCESRNHCPRPRGPVIDSVIYIRRSFQATKRNPRKAGSVPENMDTALAEERYSGVVRARTDDLDADMREPLIKAHP